MAQAQDVNLKKSGSSPVVRIVIGHAQMYTFDLVLMASADAGATMVATSDDIPPQKRTGTHDLPLPGPLQNLHQRMLSLAVAVISSTSSPTEQYSVSATLLQDGLQVANGRCERSGTLEGGVEAVTCRWWIEVAQ